MRPRTYAALSPIEHTSNPHSQTRTYSHHGHRKSVCGPTCARGSLLTLTSLIVGATQGRLRSAFSKITKLNAKQSFSFAIMVGDVFGKDAEAEADLNALISGEIVVPLRTYFSVGDNTLPSQVTARLESSEESELVPNLVYTGRKGTFTTIEDIRVVIVGGRQIENEAPTPQGPSKVDPLFSLQDAKSLRGAHSAHILITNQWPANIARLSNIGLPEGVDKDTGAQPLAELVQALKPWYHFSSSPAGVWEREVFKQPEEYGTFDEPKFTRFKSLGSIDHSVKEWVSAFTLDTTRPPPAETSTAAPFLNGSPPRKRPRLEDQGQAYDRHSGGRGRHNKRAKFDPNDCFMCIGKEEFKQHMVVSIGEESILSVVRGPLPKSDTFPQLPYTGHVLIIPMYHAADEGAHGRRPDKDLEAEFSEMTKYRKALNRMIESKGNGELGTVCYEVNRVGIRHFHWQVMPVQADKIRRGLIEGAFKIASQNHKYGQFKDCEPEKLLEERNNFFRVWTWVPSADPVARADEEANGSETDGGETKSMYFPISESGRFNVSFGREVMAGVSQLEDRVDWRACLLPNDAEEEAFEKDEADALKEGFADFDFAMQ